MNSNLGVMAGAERPPDILKFESNECRAFACSISANYALALAEREMIGVFSPRFDVHFFAANASVNSPLHCQVLDGQREQL